MSETSLVQMRNKLRAQRRRRPERALLAPPAAPVEVAAPPVDGSFVLQSASTGRVVVTTPVEQAAADSYLLRLSGRLVEGEQANSNGAFWSRDDLEFGLPSVAHGPLNWLHEESKVIGTLLDPVLVEQASADYGPHIRTEAVAWKWMNRKEIATLDGYLKEGVAWLSMECVARAIQCVGPNGCGETMPYVEAATRSERACEHVRARASHRRFIEPIFQGAAVIVPPTRPGWANADLELKKEAARQVESSNVNIDGLSEDEAHRIVAQILGWANRV